MKEIGIVLLHGAGLGSWIWSEVQSYLQFPNLSVDYPGRDNSSGVSNSTTLDDYCNHLLSTIDGREHKKIVLAAHSISGVLALKLTERLGDRVVGLVRICASIPKNGDSFISTLPFFKRMVMNVMLPIVGTKPPKGVIVKALCNDLTSDQAEAVANRFVAESTDLYFDKCNAPVPAINKMYIKTGKDQELAVSLQDEMIQNLSTQQFMTLDSGHMPMISCPKQLADALNRFVADILFCSIEALFSYKRPNRFSKPVRSIFFSPIFLCYELFLPFPFLIKEFNDFQSRRIHSCYY